MNEAHADLPAPRLAGSELQSERRVGGWSRQRWLVLVALVFAAQLILVFVLGEKHFPSPRAVANVPQLTLADSSSELIVLDDPTLFALPHMDDFASTPWRQLPVVPQPSFRWTESPLPPPLAAENFGAVFTRYMQTNRFAAPLLDFKPEPKLTEPVLPLQLVFTENSALYIEGDLAQRKWLSPVSLPFWPYADVIAPSRVQVLVDAAGAVVSAILLPPDNPGEVHDADADQRALELARVARFSPSSRLTFGQLIFDWRTVALPATNSPAATP